MENKSIKQILNKALILHKFSYGSLNSSLMDEKEFHEICNALCQNRILRKSQKAPNDAKGGQHNRVLISFENPIEYTLINENACKDLLNSFEDD